MNDEHGREIETWFANHQDGEFARFDRSVPYSLIPPEQADDVWIYCTKPAVLMQALGRAGGADWRGLSLIGRYGLPAAGTLTWITEQKCRSMIFLGDLDPVDLLIYTWIRRHLPEIKYFGICDALLATTDIVATSPIRIPWSASETDAEPLLYASFPDLSDAVGPNCFELVRSRQKIELEGALGNLVHGRSNHIAAKLIGSARVFEDT